MRFVHPGMLVLLSVLPFLGGIWIWMIRRASLRIAPLVSPSLQPRLAPPRQQARQVAQASLCLAGLGLLLVAAARPQWGRAEERVQARGRNVLIALDVSRSMLATDVHPNRLERAKVDLMDLIAELRGDRAGILVFRKTANLLCPLTTDRAFLRQTLDGIDVGSAPRGETDLADAIRKALDALSSAMDESNAILLISDGEDLAGKAIEAAAQAGKRRVPIFTVGIGDPAGAPVPSEQGTGPVQYQGKPAQTRLMDATLEAIASASGGAYVPLATAGTATTTLGAIYRQHLRRVAAAEQEERMERRYVERYQLFLLPSLACLLAAALLSRGRLAAGRAASVRRVAAGILLVLLSAPGEAAGEAPTNTARQAVQTVAPGRAGGREAQRRFRRGDYASAAEAYLQAARGVEPDEAQTYRYNAAVAWLRAAQLDKAAEAVRPLAPLPGQAEAAELLGAAQFRIAGAIPETNATGRAAALEAAAGGFRQALAAARDDDRRRRNLARSLRLLPEARQTAHVEQVLARHGGTPPQQLIETMLREQRSLLNETPAAFTNTAPQRIAACEALARRQEGNRDIWIPLKQALLQSPAITNEQQQAMVSQMVEAGRDAMSTAARRLEDLDPEGVRSLAEAETIAYGLWRMAAEPPALVGEDLRLQTNALARPAAPLVHHRPDQPEAVALSRLLVERFPAWADQMQQQAQADTNAPSLSPEARREIEQLADETVALQEKAAIEAETSERQPLQEQALRNLERIADLLPKPPSQPQPQPQQNPPPQQNPQQNPPPPEPKQEEQEQEEQEQPKPAEPPPEVKELLRRALQREKEHEAEKKRQLQQVPMRLDERDW